MNLSFVIIWGRKQVKRKLGYVADFCPVCRTITPHQVSRVGMAGHLYYIPFGQGDLIGYHGTCCKCGLLTNANPDRHTTVAPKLNPNLDDLIRTTTPDIYQRYAQRLEIELDLQRSLSWVSDDLRSALIEEPFDLIAPLAESPKRLIFDRKTMIALGILLGTAWFISPILVAMLPHQTELPLLLTLCAFGYFFFELLLRAEHKQMNQEWIPMLATALKPLNPTIDELWGQLSRLSIAHRRLGRKVKPDTLKAAIDRQS